MITFFSSLLCVRAAGCQSQLAPSASVYSLRGISESTANCMPFRSGSSVHQLGERHHQRPSVALPGCRGRLRALLRKRGPKTYARERHPQDVFIAYLLDPSAAIAL